METQKGIGILQQMENIKCYEHNPEITKKALVEFEKQKLPKSAKKKIL